MARCDLVSILFVLILLLALLSAGASGFQASSNPNQNQSDDDAIQAKQLYLKGISLIKTILSNEQNISETMKGLLRSIIVEGKVRFRHPRYCSTAVVNSAFRQKRY